MNGQEQKARHNAVLKLQAEMEQALIDVQGSILAAGEHTKAELDTIRADIGVLLAGQAKLFQDSLDSLRHGHNERLKAAQEDILALEDYVGRFVGLGFFGRLAWVLFGRKLR